MNLILEIIPPEGETQRQAFGPEGIKIAAVAGMTYRIVDPDNPAAVMAARVRKSGDDMVIDLLPGAVTITIEDYYFVCRFDFRSCFLDLESLGGGEGRKITAEQIPTERVADGSLLVWQTGSDPIAPSSPVAGDTGASSPAAPGAVQTDDRGPSPIETRGGLGTKWALVGGLGLGVVALAGAGGSDPTPVASDSTGGNAGNGAGNASSDTGNGDSGGINSSNNASDTDPPAAPAINADQIFQSTQPQISGTAEPGSALTMTINVGGSGSLVSYLTTADAAGNWFIDIASQQPNSGSLPAGGLPTDQASPVSIVARDVAGNISGATQAQIDIGQADVVTNQQVVITGAADDVGANIGALISGASTNDLTPNFSGTLLERLQVGDEVRILRDGQDIGIAQVNGTDWTFEPGQLPEGQHQFSASVVGLNGTVRATTDSTFDLTVDATAPGRPVFDPVEGNSVVDEGEVVDGVQLSGNGEAGATVQASWLGVQVSGLIDPDGSWNLEFAALPNDAGYGANSISVVQVDEAGNASVARTRAIWLELPDLFGNGDSVIDVAGSLDTAANGQTDNGLASDFGANSILDDNFSGAGGLSSI